MFTFNLNNRSYNTTNLTLDKLDRIIRATLKTAADFVIYYKSDFDSDRCTHLQFELFRQNDPEKYQ